MRSFEDILSNVESYKQNYGYVFGIIDQETEEQYNKYRALINRGGDISETIKAEKFLHNIFKTFVKEHDEQKISGIQRNTKGDILLIFETANISQGHFVGDTLMELVFNTAYAYKDENEHTIAVDIAELTVKDMKNKAKKKLLHDLENLFEKTPQKNAKKKIISYFKD